MQLTRRVAVLALGGAAASAVTVRTWSGAAGNGQPTRGRGPATAFGSVAVLAVDASTRRDPAVSHAHTGVREALGAPGSHEAWTRVLRVEVELHNGLGRPVAFSPGQFRLRLGRGGSTVTPYDSSMLPVAALPAHSTSTGTVRYLVPEDAGDLTVEFSDPVPGEVLSLPLLADGGSPATGHHGHGEAV